MFCQYQKQGIILFADDTLLVLLVLTHSFSPVLFPGGFAPVGFVGGRHELPAVRVSALLVGPVVSGWGGFSWVPVLLSAVVVVGVCCGPGCVEPWSCGLDSGLSLGGGSGAFPGGCRGSGRCRFGGGGGCCFSCSCRRSGCGRGGGLGGGGGCCGWPCSCGGGSGGSGGSSCGCCCRLP